MKRRIIFDLGEVRIVSTLLPTPGWVFREFARVVNPPPAPNYYTTCPASIAVLPVVNGVARQDVRFIEPAFAGRLTDREFIPAERIVAEELHIIRGTE